MTAVENKICNVSNLVKKAGYNTKVSEIESKTNNHNHDKYITTPEFKTFSKEGFDERLKHAKLVKTADLDTTCKKLRKN